MNMKEKKIEVLSAAFTLALFLSAGCGGKSGEKEYHKAVSAWEKGDLVHARILFEKSIHKTTGNEQKSAVWNQLGCVFWDMGETSAAAEALSQAYKLTEDDRAEVSLNAGIALFHAGRIEEAENALNTVLVEDPKNPTALTILGLIEMERSNWTEASEKLNRAVVMDTPAPIRNAFVLAQLHKNKDASRAVNELEQLGRDFPDYAPSCYNLAVVYERWLNDKNKALACYRLYARRVSPSERLLNVAEQAIARLSDTAAPTALADPKPDPSTIAEYMEKGIEFYEAKQYDKAISVYRKVIHANPKQQHAYYNMALAYYAKKEYIEAALACGSALDADSDFSNARYMLSLSYAKQKKWNRAEQEAKELAKTDKIRAEQMEKYIADARRY